MRHFAVLFVFVLPPIIAAQDPKEKEDLVKKELKQLQGTWDLSELKFFNKATSSAMLGPPTIQLEVVGQVLLTLKEGKEVARAQFTFDPTEEPKTLELMHSNQNYKLIYAIEADQVKLAMLTREGFGYAGQPKSFDPKNLEDRMGMLLITLKRTKR